jgi:hypothetical protein
MGDDPDIAMTETPLLPKTRRMDRHTGDRRHGGRSMRGRAAWLTFLVISVLLASTRGQAASTRIGVPKFAGTREVLIRKKVMQSLKSHGFELVRSRDMDEAMVRAGTSLDDSGDLKILAKNLALSAIVTGEVGAKRVKIIVHNGFDGSVLGDAAFSAASPRKLASEVALTFWQKLGPAVGRGQVPTGAKKAQKRSEELAPEDDENAPEGQAAEVADNRETAPTKRKDDSASTEESESDEPPPAPEKKKKSSRFKMEETPPEETAPPSGPAAAPWLDFQLGVGVLNRSLTFNQNVVVRGSALLVPYKLGVGPIAVGKVVAYPWLAGKVGNLGMEAEIQQGVGISSKLLATGGTFNDAVHDYAGGLRYRVLFADTDDLFFSLTAGEDAFTFNGANRASLAIPDTVYRYARVGAGTHVTIVDGLGVSFAAGYRDITNSAGHQMLHFFPRLSVAGADAEIVAHYALGDMLELGVGLEWRRYWYALNSQAGDSVVAGGAVDQSFAFTARIAILLGVSGARQAEGSAAEAPPAPKPTARPRKSPSGPSGDEESGDEESGKEESGKEESGGGDTDSGPANQSGDTDRGQKSGGGADE